MRLASWLPTRRSHFLHGDVFGNWCESATRYELSLTRGGEHNFDEHPSGAPYADRVEDDGRVLIYEGHDVAKTVNGPHPKRVDQPERNPGGSFTQNGLFGEAARKYKEGIAPPESPGLRKNTFWHLGLQRFV
jgi:hypothetical protein